MSNLGLLAAVVLAVVIVLLLAACKESTVLSALTAVVDAAEVAVPAVGAAAGLNPAQVAVVETYLKAVSDFTAQASTILAGTQSNAEKTQLILSAASSILAGCNCSGLPPGVLAVVQAVEAAVASFLENFKAAPAAVRLTAAAKTKLDALGARSRAISAKAATARGAK